MDNWMLWEIMVRQKTEELERRARRQLSPGGGPQVQRPGLRQRLATLLVAAGVHLDAEAGRAVLSPLQNHT